MSLIVNLSVGRLLSRNERLTTAKFNAVVKGIVIDISGSVGTNDLVDYAVTAQKAMPGPWFYSLATLGGVIYTAAYATGLVAYEDGLTLAFKADLISPNAMRLDAGAGDYPILKYGGHACVAGDLQAGQIAEVRFNSTLAGGCWELTSEIGNLVDVPALVAAALPGSYLTAAKNFS